VGAGLLVLGFAILAMGRAVRDRARAGERAVIDRLVADARRDSASTVPELLAQAVEAYDRALDRAAAAGLDLPGQVRQDRDTTARQLARARLDSLLSLPPPQQLDELRAFADWSRSETALAADRATIETELSRVAGRVAISALDRASASADSEPDRSLEDAALALAAAELAAPAQSVEIRKQAAAQAAGVARRRGIVLDLSRGRTVHGSADSYRDLEKLICNRLNQRGYVVRPTSGPWTAAWDQEAAYRLTIRVEETSVPYLGSALSATRLDADLALRRGPATLWATHVNGQTRTPPPGMPAFEASRLAMATSTDASVELILFRDALAVLLDRLGMQINSLPAVP
jgi:hypothetical protein